MESCFTSSYLAKIGELAFTTSTGFVATIRTDSRRGATIPGLPAFKTGLDGEAADRTKFDKRSPALKADTLQEAITTKATVAEDTRRAVLIKN